MEYSRRFFSNIFFESQNPCFVFPNEFGPDDVGVSLLFSKKLKWIREPMLWIASQAEFTFRYCAFASDTRPAFPQLRPRCRYCWKLMQLLTSWPCLVLYWQLISFERAETNHFNWVERSFVSSGRACTHLSRPGRLREWHRYFWNYRRWRTYYIFRA